MSLRLFAVLPAALLVFGSAIAVGGSPVDPTPDPAAYALLKEAHDNRSSFPAGFPGLTANIVMNDNGKEVKGDLAYSAAGDLDVKLTDATKEEEDWAKEQLGSALSHRRSDNFAHTDGNHPITFVQDDHSPLGRQVSLNDGLKSFYRVKDKQITEVTRTMGDLKFTITVMENTFVDGGKYLPSQFVVTYFDAGTGAIKQVEDYSDGYTKVSGAWVPVSRRIVSAESSGFTTRTYTLRNIRMTAPKATASR